LTQNTKENNAKQNFCC